MKFQRGSRGTNVLLSLKLGARWGGWLTPRPCYISHDWAGTHCTGCWLVLREAVDLLEKSHSTEIRSPNPSVRRQSLYPLRYPGLRYRCCRVLLSTAEKNLILPTWYPTISFALLPSQNGISNIFHFNRTSIPFRSLPRSFRPPLHHFLSFQSPLRFPLQMLYCTK
jgi:hypothetical protein